MLTILFAEGCARKVHVALAARTIPRIGHSETGLASWYGEPYHGRATASGEIFDMNRWTAAHRTLALGTWVEVTNLTNAKHVQVRINDRGPFVEGRVIDLSRAAARDIGMERQGIARVHLQVIHAPAGENKELYVVQVAELDDRAAAAPRPS